MISGRIYLFGALQLIPGDLPDAAPLDIRSTKLQALLAFLSLHSHQPLARDRLASHLWPQTRPSAARRNLREYLYRARHLLAEFLPGVDILEADDSFVTFAPPPECWIDLVEFERLAGQAQHVAASAEVISLLNEAVALYRGDLLTNLYDDWVITERERVRTMFIDVLAQLGHQLQQAGQLTDAIAIIERLLRFDPLREEEHRRLMELYYAAGDRARALEQYRICCQILSEELASDPMPETQALHAAILNNRVAVAAPPPAGQPVLAPRRPPPFVGRQAELARLTQTLTESRSGRPNICVVAGDSGLGKTRLVNEWLAAQPLETIILRGHGYEFEQDIPYRPLLDALQESLHRIPWDTLPPNRTYTWLAPLAQLLPDLYYHLPDLPAPAHADGDISHYVMEGLTQLILSLARQSPVILFLDDLHWADVSTWRFLPFLARRVRQMPVFVVGTFCTSEAGQPQRAHLLALERNHLARLLNLSRLWPDDVARLVGQMLDLPSDRLTPLAHRLQRETQGNPFFVIEMVKALAESDPPPSYTPDILARLPTPSAVQALIQNRLDRLPPDSCQALSIAAVIGRAFGFRLLAEVTQIEEDVLLDCLDDWLARGLIVEQTPGRYDFSHTLVREVAAARLSRPRRRHIHYRIARALETAHPADIERVAYHDSFSDQPIRAVPNLLEAGRRALNLRSYQEARKIGQTVLDILQHAPPRQVAPDRLELSLQRALACCLCDRLDEALPLLEEAVGLAQTVSDTIQVGEIALRMAQVYWLRGDAPQARRYGEWALDLVKQADLPSLSAAVLRLLGRVGVAQGDFRRAAEYLQQSLALEFGPESHLNRAAALGYLSIALAHLGRQDEAIAALNEAQQIARSVESLTTLAIIQVQAAVAYSVLEQWNEAKRLASLGLDACEAQDLPVYAFVARSVLGRVAHYQNDDDEAYRLLRSAIAWAKANRYILFRHMAHVYLAEAALSRGDAKTVRAQCKIALVLARCTGNRWTETRVRSYLEQLERG